MLKPAVEGVLLGLGPLGVVVQEGVKRIGKQVVGPHLLPVNMGLAFIMPFVPGWLIFDLL